MRSIIIVRNTWTKKEKFYPEIFTDEKELLSTLESLKATCSKTGKILNNEYEVVDLIGKAYALIV